MKFKRPFILFALLVLPVLLFYSFRIGNPKKSVTETAQSAPAPETSPRTIVPEIKDEIRAEVILKLLADISTGRSLPYPQDGTVFHNREGLLPKEKDGFYKEYTLIIPGRNAGAGRESVIVGGKAYATGPMLGQRGPERIVTGADGSVYYTPDHYSTFIRLKIGGQ